MSACARWLLVAALMVAAPVVNAEDSAALIARMQAAGIQNSLDAPGIKPWHLKVSFQLFDDQQKLSNQGTMDEWWAGPDLYKITFASTSFTATEIKDKEGVFWSEGSASLPFMLHMVHQMVVHPLPSDKEIEDYTAKLESRFLGGVKLDCILLKPNNKKNPALLPRVAVPTYCFDRDDNKLRLYTPIGYLEVARNRMGSFQQRSVALDMFVTDIGPTIVTAHITALTSFQPSPVDFDASSPAWTPAPKPIPTEQNIPGVVPVRKISGFPPNYPETARENHVQGSVVMTARIGTDGHIHQLEVVASPDRNLSMAARDAVQHWVYQPYLLYGTPTEVATTITVNFQMSGIY